MRRHILRILSFQDMIFHSNSRARRIRLFFSGWADIVDILLKYCPNDEWEGGEDEVIE